MDALGRQPASRSTTITAQLVEDGVRLFADAADQLYAAVQKKRRTVLGSKLNAMSYKLPEGSRRRRQGGAGGLAQGGQGPAAVGRRRLAVDRAPTRRAGSAG